MSVIIRLQNLPWSANALDIRQYFHGLGIPEGGVHIVGGELGDAFIAFSTDEDARQAFERNNGKLKEVQIKLMLSSRTEMQKVIESARSQTIAPYLQVPAPMITIPAPIPLPTAVPQVPQSFRKDDKDIDSDKERSDKRDRRRSRSWSRDRSRERDRRDRRRRDRSRSRSRDRRDRRRRDRSYSRERHRSRDRDRKTSRDRRRSDDKPIAPNVINPPKDQKAISPWEQKQEPTPQVNPPLGMLTNPNLDIPLRNVNMPTPPNISNFGSNSMDGFKRDNWQQNMSSRFSDNSMPFARGPDRNFSSPVDRFNPNVRPGGSPFGFADNGNRFSNRTWPNGDQNKPFNDRAGGEPFRDRRRDREVQQDNCCVRIHPFYGGFGEIRRFFHGLFIHNSGIKLLNDKFGKRTGWVYVRFVYPEGKEEALRRNGGFMRKQPIEILHLSDDDFEKEIDRYQPPDYVHNIDDDEDDDVIIQDSPNSYRAKSCPKNDSTESPRNSLQNYTCLVVEDLPTYVKEQDILKIFSDYSLMSILIIENRKHRKSLMAYVKFANSEHAKNACVETIMHTLEGKPLKVKPCSDEDFDAVNNQQDDLMGGDEPPKLVKVDSECVCLTGLPPSINERDIADFFCDVGIVPDKIHLINNETGFSGKAYCQFVNLDEAQAAVGKDGTYLGTGVITVKSVSRPELEDEVGIRPPPQILPPMNNMNNMNPMHMNPRPFFRNNFNNMHMGPRGPGFMGPRPFRFQGPPKDAYMGPPGCTILMENVPYKAELDEILEFFSDFNIPADNVLRRFNPNGQPSGETKVIFGSPDEAHTAVQSMNREKIRDRVVYLSLC